MQIFSKAVMNTKEPHRDNILYSPIDSYFFVFYFISWKLLIRQQNKHIFELKMFKLYIQSDI